MPTDVSCLLTIHLFVSLDVYIHPTNSENRPQSKKQQQYNNKLVNMVHQRAVQCGYTFDPLSFGSGSGSSSASSSKQSANARKLPTKANKGNDVSNGDNDFNYKKLRDRIRCYYKTHVQNSKKRLITLLKNPTRPKNREVLLKIVDEVKDHAARGDGVGRKLSPNGKAAIRRLEAKEQSLYPSLSSSSLVVSPDLATPESSRHVIMVPRASYPWSSGTREEQWMNQTTASNWPAPPSPRRVSMEPSHYGHRMAANTGGNNNLNAEAPFASPCKPEHVAMLASIRQVSVPQRVQF